MHSLVQRQIPRRRHMAAALLLAMLAAFLFVVDRANAADVGGQVTWNRSIIHGTHTGSPYPEYGQWDTVRMEIDWNVTSGTVQGGDYFEVPMGGGLNPASFDPFDLMDGSTVIAKATTSPDNPNNIRFTFQPAVNGLNNVHGNAFYEMGLAQLEWDDGELSRNVQVLNSTIRINRDMGPTGTWDGKWGYFMGNESVVLERDQEGRLVSPGPHIKWGIDIQTKVNGNDWSTLNIVDTLRPGLRFTCPAPSGAVAMDYRPSYGANPAPYPAQVGITVTDCTASQIKLTITKPAANQGIFTVYLDSWITTNGAGQPVYGSNVGFPPDGFGNDVTMEYVGIETVPHSSVVRRTDQGGSGTGDNLHPKIDIEKYSGAWDGVIFNEGVPQLDEAGQPVNQPAGDYDNAPGLPVASGASTPVTFQITNTGDETLDNVQVSDQTLAGTALTNVVCIFGESSQMPFNGFRPGESFTCTATLGPITEAHADRASVTAIGQTSRQNVGDQDDWHAQPPPVTPNPKIDIEKYSGDWNGVTFVNGVAQLDAAGQPVNQPAGDHDTAPGLEVAAGASTPVTFRITNTGNEILDNVQVSDQTLAGTALTNVVCTFGGSTTMPFQGLAPGQSFTCTATLGPITAAHADRASVTAIGRTSRQNVSDQDDWHARPAAPTRTTLSIRKVALTRSPRAGTTMSWRVEVRNRGAIAAQNVRICDTLPRALTLGSKSVRVDLIGNGRTTRTTAKVSMVRGQACITLKTLAVGQMARFTIQTRIARTVVGNVRNPVTANAANANRVSAAARVSVQRALVAGQNLPAVTG